ncbi:MAG: chain-length determining protein [Bacteroidaceae bacterium]|nr:chain-length determining protein [Bacteroidaceae bacterium]
MEENSKESVTTVRLSSIVKVVRQNKKRFAINLILAFVLSCAYIICIPRYYKAEVRLAPEVESATGLSSLSSIASSFGFDIASGQSNDAFGPELYPDLFESNDFIVPLLDITVTAPSKGVDGVDYYTYLTTYQDETPWSPAFKWVKKLFKRKRETYSLGDSAVSDSTANKPRFNPFYLSELENMVVETVQGNIVCTVDKKTDVISITVTDQDPVAAALIADSVRVRLQEFITEYRTTKARNDAEYYKMLLEQAHQEYEDAIDAYGRYADAHVGQLRQSYQTRLEELQNTKDVKLNTFVALEQQYQNSIAKVQERTPAFTVLQNASVPLKPAGPKRMIFVLFILVLTSVGTYTWLIRAKIKAVLGLADMPEDKDVE